MPSVKHTGDMTKQRRQITEYLVIILRFFFFEKKVPTSTRVRLEASVVGYVAWRAA
jgi:hypothetical protein